MQTASGASTRIASQYLTYNSFTINMNLTDGNSHRVALYLLDWEGAGRAETITITDAASGAILNTQNFFNFQQGIWAVWNLKGNVAITVTKTGNGNATVSGIFFGAPASSAAYVGQDTATQGTWTGTYGTDGNLMANNSTAPPSYATVSLSGDSTWTWTTSSTELRDLQTASGATTRIASQYYSYGSFTINVNLADGNSHRVALYLLDWDTTTRSETVTITDAVSGAVLSTQNFSNFSQGVWAVWNLKGNVIITVTNTGPAGHSNATVSGIFFRAPATITSSATYGGTDTTTQGTWTGTYGTDGNWIANDSTATPAYAAVSLSGDSTWTWTTSSTELRNLQTASGSATRIASQYYSYGSFTINVNLTDGNSHRVALYLLDWDTTTRSETITITDAVSGKVLNAQSLANFNQGVWAVWNLKGNVIITVTNTGPVGDSNATVSSIFFN